MARQVVERCERAWSRRAAVDAVICALPLLSAARWWNDTVHPQILDYLSVVIEGMSWGKGCKEQACGRPATARSNRLDEVRAVQSRDHFVPEGEGIFQVLNDFGLGF